jgi:hypothetical protein
VFGPLVDTSSAPLALHEGDEVTRYVTDHEAVVRTASGVHEIAASTAPLRARGVSGVLGPVDLSLVRRDGVLVPANGAVQSSIGENAGDGVSFAAAGLTISPVLGVGGRGVVGSVDQTYAFYADVAPDSDLIAKATSSGAEYLSQLRSPDSPEVQRYAVGLPAGASLEQTDAGVEVVECVSMVAMISAPSAVDAQGRDVPVSRPSMAMTWSS